MRYLRVDIVLFILTFFLGGCVTIERTVYGVPVEHWEVMNEKERDGVVARYQKREELRHVERLRRVRDGRSGLDRCLVGQRVIEVEIFGGKMNLGGRHARYDPVRFVIVCGDKRTLRFSEKGMGAYVIVRDAEVVVEYVDGYLMFDTQYEKYAWQVRANSRWREGVVYRNITLNDRSFSEARKINVRVRFVNNCRGCG